MLLYCIWLSMVAVIRSSDIAISPIAVEPPVKLGGVFMGPGPVIGVPPMPFIPVKPTKTLGETCGADGECATAFAQCAASVCTCRDGFEASEKGLCTPKSYSCPIGEPLLNNGSPMRCQRVLNAGQDIGPIPVMVPQRKKRMSPVMSMPPMMPGPQFNDSCPETYFCLVHNNHYYESSSGHCCPSPKAVCPVGEALDASCSPYTMPMISAAQFPPIMANRCPYETHYCQSIVIGGQPVGKDACCPKPCSDQDIYHEGQCYARALIGETCTIQQQCEGNQGTCVSGTCQCKKGYVSVGAGFCQRPYCAGVDVNQMPLEPLVTAVGNIMRCNASKECPSSAYCTGSDQTCCPLPEPTCPQMGFGPQQPHGKCDPNNFSDEQCGPNGYCYRYYYAAETMSTDGGVCCDRGMPVLPMEPGPVILQASPDFA